MLPGKERIREIQRNEALPMISTQRIQRKQALPMISTQRKMELLGVDQSRASWNPGLEKDLVCLLHKHNNTSFRGQKGWSRAAWNTMVKEFLRSHPYLMMTKVQIQEKEKELKRDYRMLKELRKQEGASWNDQRFMIDAEPAFWSNMFTSFPRAKKFRGKPFPLFDALEELYDGHTAEGNLNFTVAKPSQHPIVTQIDNNVDESLDTEIHFADIQERTEHDDDVSTSSEHTETRAEHEQNQQKNSNTTSREKGEKKLKKRKKSADVAGMMMRYLELRIKQAKEEAAELARQRVEQRNVDDFSIKKCISVVNTMEELSIDEKVRTFRVLRNDQNREIFLSADPVSRLVWLRTQMDL